MMGSPDDEPGRSYGEDLHQVTLTQGFNMAKYETTVSQYAKFLNDAGVGQNASLDGGPIKLFFEQQDGSTPVWNDETLEWEASGSEPMVWVTWFGAEAYADWVGGALPTEAQWEYACRAGTSTPYSFGSDPALLGDYAWFQGNSWGEGLTNGPSPVGQKLPNAWGLYDMHGNVFEWCSDQWDLSENYPSAGTEGTAISDPLVTTGSNRVLRGGSWGYSAVACRSAYRVGDYPDLGFDYYGFRVVFP